MASEPRLDPVGRLWVSLATTLLILLLLTALAAASAAAGDSPAGDAAPSAGATGSAAGSSPATPLTETITVTATRSPRRVADTPGEVRVIEAAEIERHLAADLADLVRFEPGVDVDGDPTRLGLDGFNVRGIGGNRVATRVDGVPTAEQFDFGPLSIHEFALDPEALRSVEIVRSAGSALYGSDALGGVVSLLTKDPADFLAGGDGHGHLGARLGWDSRRDEAGAALSLARGGERWQGSLFVSARDGGESDNQGTRATADATRTAPNPMEREAGTGLAKLTWLPKPAHFVRFSVEGTAGETATDVLSGRGVQDFGPQFGPGITFFIATEDFTSVDTQVRLRLGIDHEAQLGRGPLGSLSSRLYAQTSQTDQRTEELRSTTQGGGFFGPLRTTRVARGGRFTFEQETLGGETVGRRAHALGGAEALATFGIAASRDRFDMLRDRRDVNLATGAVVPSDTPHPTKYFPASRVDQTGVFVQEEVTFAGGRLRLVPGLRFDRYELSVDETDEVYFAGNPGTPPPTGTTESAVSPRLGLVWAPAPEVSVFAQWAEGFRAPPFSEVNSGFTNQPFGYVTLPNPDLEPETSRNLEAGVRLGGARGSLSLFGFANRTDDFIETVDLGVDPATGLLRFQPQNLRRASIEGVEASGDLRFAGAWRLRAAAAWIEGEDADSGRPLDSIPPAQATAGLAYAAARWSAELAATRSFGKDEGDLDDSLGETFTAPAYTLVDLFGSVDLAHGFALQGGVFNLLDETTWRWGEVRGRPADDPAIDRYSAPGRGVSLALRWRR